MTYAVNEMFYTLQGEGRNAGRAAVFCRFAGCNLWSGQEADRAAAACWFCDTDFVGTAGEGGGKFHAADELAAADELERHRAAIDPGIKMPAGCVCPPDSWDYGTVEPICDSYEGSIGEHCWNCEHDKACHYP